MTTDTRAESVHADQDAAELRGAMVDEVIVDREWVGVVPREVEVALRTVPRHLFAPEVPMEEAYADRSIVTKRTERTERGAAISSVSAPSTQAMMLGQLQVAPGQRVLEIGSGGYNAALLRELVGPEGSVTTLDIDEEIADRARACLATAGYRDVCVVCADGELGAPEHGPFDRIIVTVGTYPLYRWTAQSPPHAHRDHPHPRPPRRDPRPGSVGAPVLGHSQTKDPHMPWAGQRKRQSRSR